MPDICPGNVEFAAELPVSAGGFSDRSPDGQQIAFSSSRDLNPELYLVSADGTGLRRLTTDTAVDFLPRWSPDGTTLAFASDRGAPATMPLPESDLWLLDLATGETRPLTNGLGDVLAHSWSPDGRSVHMTRDDSILAVDLDGGTETVITEGCCASIAPDGHRLVVSRER